MGGSQRDDPAARKVSRKPARWSPASLDARLGLIERHVKILADRLGIDLEQVSTEASPGVRFDMPSTYNEWVAARSRLDDT